jgi:signal transduction histidine kinase
MDNARLFGDLQQAVDTRDAVLAAASHDLKNPLAAIKGAVQLLQRQAARAGGVPPARLTAGLASVDAAVSRMAAQLDELLDVAHLEVGRPLDLRRRPTDLVAAAYQAVGEHQPTTTRHRLQVHAAVPSLVGSWDAARLDRVLANLLSNAIKYSPAGGTITVELLREHDDNGDWAVLRVRDQGMGIPAADVPHVFERFHRGRNVGGQIRGSGIGLAGVRQIVEQHGGTIAVESQEGVGSTFTVRLPLLLPGARGATAPAPQAPEQASRPAPSG